MSTKPAHQTRNKAYQVFPISRTIAAEFQHHSHLSRFPYLFVKYLASPTSAWKHISFSVPSSLSPFCFPFSPSIFLSHSISFPLFISIYTSLLLTPVSPSTLKLTLPLSPSLCHRPSQFTPSLLPSNPIGYMSWYLTLSISSTKILVNVTLLASSVCIVCEIHLYV